ncbi:MAG: hypothetical protein H0X64_08825 [Gemmatimonadaceae bacterium]|nr:hypothetical protein [Gemmatimonadaceae bacterium]
MPASIAGMRFPYSRILLPRTRLAYVHLRNLLTDAKRDRSARVSGYVVIWLPDELLLLYMQRGEVVNATSFDGKAWRTISIVTALAHVPAEPEYGEVCFHEADDDLLSCMFAAQATPAEGWPSELRVTDPKVLFSYLMATTFDGMVEIESGAHANYLLLNDGTVDHAYLAAPNGRTMVERVTDLFARDARGLHVRRWHRPGPLPAQAPPALVQAYRELAAALVARVASAGRDSAPAIAEHARASLLPRHPVLDTITFTERPARDTVSDAPELTAAMASWIQEFMWAAADHESSSPEQLLRDVVWERRHIFQSAGLFDRIPWKVA